MATKEARRLPDSITDLTDRTVVRPRDLGISAKAVARLLRDGRLERIAHGLYEVADADITQHHTLAQVATVVPSAIVCLISALNFHNLGTQAPHGAWIGIEARARKPEIEWVTLRVFRFSGAGMTFGVDTHVIEGVPVKVTSRERTVADCFKYRNKVGLDVAIEALREYLDLPGRSIDALTEASEVRRVYNVMCPYVEALLAS